MENEDQEKQTIEVQHLDVIPSEADWDPVMDFRPQWKYRVFFQKSASAFANSLHLADLRYFLEDNCGQEDVHWIAEPCPEPERYTVQGEDEETMKRGNRVYLTDMSWLINLKLGTQATPDAENPWDKITIIETRIQ